MRKATAVIIAVIALATLACFPPEPAQDAAGPTSQGPPPDAVANRLQAHEARLNRISKDIDRLERNAAPASPASGANPLLAARLERLEARVNQLERQTAGSSRPDATYLMTPETAPPEAHAIVRRMADCIAAAGIPDGADRQSEPAVPPTADELAWRYAADATTLPDLERTAGVVCQIAGRPQNRIP